LFKLQNYTLSQ